MWWEEGINGSPVLLAAPSLVPSLTGFPKAHYTFAVSSFADSSTCLREPRVLLAPADYQAILQAPSGIGEWQIYQSWILPLCEAFLLVVNLGDGPQGSSEGSLDPDWGFHRLKDGYYKIQEDLQYFHCK